MVNMTTETVNRAAKFHDFCARVRFTATRGNKEAAWAHSNKPGQHNQHYRCTFSMHGGRRMTCDFFQSIAATERGEVPTCADVMSCLLSDASCYESEPNIDDFAANFGGEKTPISQTIAAFKACKNRARSLRNFWGGAYDAVQEASGEY